MEELDIYNKNVDIEIIGDNILKTNKFLSDLCSLMKNTEFITFYNEYFKDWSDIQCMIFYIKLYTTIEYEYTNRFKKKISSQAMAYTIKKIMDNEYTRSFALDLFKDFTPLEI